MNDLVVVKEYNSRLEAEISKSKLEAYGIQAIISSDDAGGMYPFPLSPNSHGVRLLVNKKDYQKAVKLLQ